MPDIISTLRAGGYTDDEISAWSTSMRQRLSAGGYSDKEIDDYLGIPTVPKNVPAALVDRIINVPKVPSPTPMFLSQDENGKFIAAPLPTGAGINVPQAPKGIVERAVEPVKGAFEEPLGISQENLDKYTWANYLQPFAKAGDALLRVPGAAIGGFAGAISGGLETAGAVAPTEASRLQRDLDIIGQMAAIESGQRSMQRVTVGPTGEPTTIPIGKLPRGEDIIDAGKIIGNGDSTPLMEKKLVDLYEQKGIHPAEVAHDAQTDATITQSILSSDKEDMPAAYGPIPALRERIIPNWRNNDLDYVRKHVSVGKDTIDLSFGEGLEPRLLATENGIEFWLDKFGNAIHATTGSEKTPSGFQIGPLVGTIKTAMKNGERVLDHVVVSPEYQRRGIGTRLLGLLEQANPAVRMDLNTGLVSPEGAALVNAYNAGGRPPPPPGGPLSAAAPAAPAGKPPSYSDAEKAILAKISIGEKAPEAKLTLDEAYTRFLDKTFPLSKKVAEINPDIAPEDNPHVLARLLAGWVGKADHFLNNGTFDFATYENNGKSLKEILKPIADDLNGFRAYAAASRAVELQARGIKSGFGLGELETPGLNAATVVKEGAAKYENTFREIVEYQNRVTKYLRDSGVLSAKGYDAMLEANKNFVPFYRVMGLDEGASYRSGSSLQARNPIKKIKGSGRDIIDPIESIVRNTYHFIEMAERNQIGTKLVDMLEATQEHLPEAPKAATKSAGVEENSRGAAMAGALDDVGIKGKGADELTQALAYTLPDKEGEITILRDGKAEKYTVDRDIARAMKGLDAQSSNWLVNLLGVPARILRAGAVLNPEFWGRHTIRDFLYATTTIKEGVFTPFDMAKGFAGLIMRDEDYWNWLKGGGGNISIASIGRQYLQEDLRNLTGQTGLIGRAWNVLSDPEATMWQKTKGVGVLPFQAIDKFLIDPLRGATLMAENASHLGAFKKSMRASERAEPEATDLRSQIIRAAWVSRDTAVDAARMGANMRGYNLISAFANIKLQDTDRVVRAIRDNPVKTLAMIGGAITAPSVILWAANHNDPRYNEIPQWEKDFFWLVMTPDHVFRIPKPWAMGMVFGSAVEHMLDAYVAEKPDAFKDFFKDLYQTSGPEFVPTAAAPIIDQFANRSTFTNRTLIPSAQEKFLPEYQYTPYTTEATKALGQIIGAFPGISQLKLENSGRGGTARAITSPILMENYIRGWTGTLGMYALNAADAALRKTGVLPDPPLPTSTLADIPVIKAFVVRYPTASAESIQKFYDGYEQNKKFFDTWVGMAKDGNLAAMDHIQQMGGPEMFVQLDGIHKTLSEHSQIIRDIYKNAEIPPAEKRQLIDQLYYSMIQVGQFGNQALDQMRAQAASVVRSPVRLQ